MKKVYSFLKKIKNIGFKKNHTIKLVMCLLCKDEIDIIEDWLIFHKNMGVDYFIVTDNRSKDGTRDILEKYYKKGWIYKIIDEPEQGYCQQKWVHRMVLYAKRLKADWVISSDADEFRFPRSLNLKTDIIANKGCNVQSVYLNDYIPINNNDDFFKESYFRIRGFKDFEKDVYKIDKKSFYYKQSFTSKVIFKTKNYVYICGGNHDVQMFNKKKCNISNIIIYHYYMRNLKQFTLKVKKGGEALRTNNDLCYGYHWRDNYSNYYLKNKIDILFRQYLDPDSFKKMLMLGAVTIDPSVPNYLKWIKSNPKAFF